MVHLRVMYLEGVKTSAKVRSRDLATLYRKGGHAFLTIARNHLTAHMALRRAGTYDAVVVREDENLSGEGFMSEVNVNRKLKNLTPVPYYVLPKRLDNTALQHFFACVLGGRERTAA